jgi:hypothetical protein
LNAALGKLPGTLPDAPTPEQAPLPITQDDANVKSITLRVDHVKTGLLKSSAYIFSQPTTFRYGACTALDIRSFD